MSDVDSDEEVLYYTTEAPVEPEHAREFSHDREIAGEPGTWWGAIDAATPETGTAIEAAVDEVARSLGGDQAACTQCYEFLLLPPEDHGLVRFKDTLGPQIAFVWRCPTCHRANQTQFTAPILTPSHGVVTRAATSPVYSTNILSKHFMHTERDRFSRNQGPPITTAPREQYNSFMSSRIVPERHDVMLPDDTVLPRAFQLIREHRP